MEFKVENGTDLKYAIENLAIGDNNCWIKCDAYAECPDELNVTGTEGATIADEYFTKEGLYVLMGRSARDSNGKLIGHNQIVSQEATDLWLSLVDGEVMTTDEMREEVRWNGLSFAEQQQETIKKLKAEKTDVTFELEVTSEAKGEPLDYVINLKTWSELQTQYGLSGTLAFHDESRTMHEAYTGDVAKKLMKDIALEVTDRDCRYDVWITRATMMTEGDLTMIKNIPISPEEQGYIDSIKAAIEAAFV